MKILVAFLVTIFLKPGHGSYNFAARSYTPQHFLGRGGSSDFNDRNGFYSKYNTNYNSISSPEYFGSYKPSYFRPALAKSPLRSSASSSASSSRGSSSFGSLPATPTSSSYSVLPPTSTFSSLPTAPTPTSFSYFPRGSPFNQHLQQPTASAPSWPSSSAAGRPWSQAPTTQQTPAASLNTPAQFQQQQQNLPPIIYGSSQNLFSQQQQQSPAQKSIYTPSPTATTKPPTYSISFSTSVLGNSNGPRPSSPHTRSPADEHAAAAGVKQAHRQPALGFGRGQQALPTFSPPLPSPTTSGGAPRGQQALSTYAPPTATRGGDPEAKFSLTFTPPSAKALSEIPKNLWGRLPWSQQHYEDPQDDATTTVSLQRDQPNGKLPKFTTESSHSSSYTSLSSSEQHAPQQHQEGKAQREAQAAQTTATTFTNRPKNPQPNPTGLPAGPSRLSPHPSKESFGLSALYPWNAKSDSKKKTSGKQRKSSKKEQGSSFNIFGKTEFELEEENEEGRRAKSSPDSPLLHVKEGSFSWKGSDGKVYEVRYTADSQGVLLEGDDKLESLESSLNPSFLSESKISPSESSKDLPIRIKIAAEESSGSYSSPNHQNSFSLTPDEEFSSPYELEKELEGGSNKLQIIELNSQEISQHHHHHHNDKSEWTTAETPPVVISFGTGTSSTSPLFIPLSDEQTNEHKSTDYYLYDHNQNGNSHAEEFSGHGHQDNFPQRTSQLLSPSKSKMSYAIRHHSYSKSQSSSDNISQSNALSNSHESESPQGKLSSYQKRYHKRASSGNRRRTRIRPTTSAEDTTNT